MLVDVLLLLSLAMSAYNLYIYAKMRIKIKSIDSVYNRFDELESKIESIKVHECTCLKEEISTEAKNGEDFYMGSNGLYSYHAYEDKMFEKYARPRDVGGK